MEENNRTQLHSVTTLSEQERLEWEAFAKELEDAGLLHAPKQMKQSVLDRIAEEERAAAMAAASNQKETMERKLFYYRMKICGVMAASFVLLFATMPLQTREGASAHWQMQNPLSIAVKQWENPFSEWIGDGSQHMNDTLEGVSRRLFELRREVMQK